MKRAPSRCGFIRASGNGIGESGGGAVLVAAFGVSRLDESDRLWHAPGMGISAKQFEQLQQRASGKRGVSEPALNVPSSPKDKSPQVLLGIDPSLRGTGFGFIKTTTPQPVALAHGTIKCPSGMEKSRCLAVIARTLRERIAEFKPTVCVIEGLFHAQNVKTALTMGEARGAALVAAAEAGLEIYEIAPRKVKQAIVGFGAAQKEAVARMVQRMLGLDEQPEPDAADALALALTHSQINPRNPLTALKKV